MFSYMKGELVEILDDAIVLEVNHIGYHIYIPASMIDKFSGTGQTLKIYTYFHVKEDSMKLYGFLNSYGIGPKGALAILTVLTPDDLRFAILGDDAKTIAKAPGIGAKTAQRLILELKDKLDLQEALEVQMAHAAKEVGEETAISGIRSEAVQALTALGYSATEALKAVNAVEFTEGITVEEVLKASLRQMVLC